MNRPAVGLRSLDAPALELITWIWEQRRSMVALSLMRRRLIPLPLLSTGSRFLLLWRGMSLRPMHRLKPVCTLSVATFTFIVINLLIDLVKSVLYGISSNSCAACGVVALRSRFGSSFQVSLDCGLSRCRMSWKSNHSHTFISKSMKIYRFFSKMNET